MVSVAQADRVEWVAIQGAEICWNCVHQADAAKGARRGQKGKPVSLVKMGTNLPLF